MWMIPTRGRPEDMAALINAATSTGSPRAAVMIDQDDPAPYNSIGWPPGWHVHYALDHLELAGALNRLFEFYPDEPFYGVLADHARPRTPGWDKTVAEAAGDWNIAYTDDGWLHGRRQDDPSRPRICGAIALGGKLVRAAGWLIYPKLVHLYVDDVWEAIGEDLGLLKYLPHVLSAVDRPETTGRPRDENHARVWRGRRFHAMDASAFAMWNTHHRAETVALIRKAMEDDNDHRR